MTAANCIEAKVVGNDIGIQMSKYSLCLCRVQNVEVCLPTKQRLTKIAIFPGKYQNVIYKTAHKEGFKNIILSVGIAFLSFVTFFSRVVTTKGR